MSESQLIWEITAQENRNREKKRLILRLFFWLSSGLLLVFFIGFEKEAWFSFLAFILIILGAHITLLIMNHFNKYPNRSYSLTEEKLCVGENEIEQCYQWSDFECFYEAPGAKNKFLLGEQLRRRLRLDSIDKQTKKPFYLEFKTKPGRQKIKKEVLVIYAEPDNVKQVFDFLSEKIKRKEKIWGGLVNYRFK